MDRFLLIWQIKRTNAQSLVFSGRSRPFCFAVARIFVSRVTRPPKARRGIRRMVRSSPHLVVVGAKAPSQSPLNYASASRRKLRPLPCSVAPHENRSAGVSRGAPKGIRAAKPRSGAFVLRPPSPVLRLPSLVPRRGGGCSRLRPQARFGGQPPAGRLLGRRWSLLPLE